MDTYQYQEMDQMKYIDRRKPILLYFLILLCLIYLTLTIIAFISNSSPHLASTRIEIFFEALAKLFLGLFIPIILTWGVYVKSNWARNTFLITSLFISSANIFYFKAVYFDREFPNLKVDYFQIAINICVVLVPIILVSKSMREWCKEEIED